jgi:hypothetical protein
MITDRTPLIPTDDDIEHIVKLLAIHRRTLRHLCRQAAEFGGEHFAPPATANGIMEARKTIRSNQNILRAWGVAVSDHFGDESIYNALKRQPAALPSGTIPNLLPPPEFATYLLWFLPKQTREVVIGDLEEEFHIIYNRFGRRKAVVWYYYQVSASFWPFAVSGAKKLIKWGVFGWVGDLVRRMIS